VSGILAVAEKQNARKLFANYFFGFDVRRGDCFINFGSRPSRSGAASGGNLGLPMFAYVVRPVGGGPYLSWS
jgi:hypothetical protein